MQLPVRAIALSPDGKHALSASDGERQIAVWHLDGPSTKKSQASCGLLSMEDPAVQIASSASPSSAPSDTFQVFRACSVALQERPCHCTEVICKCMLATLDTCLAAL